MSSVSADHVSLAVTRRSSPSVLLMLVPQLFFFLALAASVRPDQSKPTEPPILKYWATWKVNTTIFDSQGLPWYCFTTRQTFCRPLFRLSDLPKGLTANSTTGGLQGHSGQGDNSTAGQSTKEPLATGAFIIVFQNDKNESVFQTGGSSSTKTVFSSSSSSQTDAKSSQDSSAVYDSVAGNQGSGRPGSKVVSGDGGSKNQTHGSNEANQNESGSSHGVTIINGASSSQGADFETEGSGNHVQDISEGEVISVVQSGGEKVNIDSQGNRTSGSSASSSGSSSSDKEQADQKNKSDSDFAVIPLLPSAPDDYDTDSGSESDVNGAQKSKDNRVDGSENRAKNKSESDGDNSGVNFNDQDSQDSSGSASGKSGQDREYTNRISRPRKIDVESGRESNTEDDSGTGRSFPGGPGSQTTNNRSSSVEGKTSKDGDKDRKTESGTNEDGSGSGPVTGQGSLEGGSEKNQSTKQSSDGSTDEKQESGSGELKTGSGDATGKDASDKKDSDKETGAGRTTNQSSSEKSGSDGELDSGKSSKQSSDGTDRTGSVSGNESEDDGRESGRTKTESRTASAAGSVADAKDDGSEGHPGATNKMDGAEGLDVHSGGHILTSDKLDTSEKEQEKDKPAGQQDSTTTQVQPNPLLPSNTSSSSTTIESSSSVNKSSSELQAKSQDKDRLTGKTGQQGSGSGTDDRDGEKTNNSTEDNEGEASHEGSGQSGADSGKDSGSSKDQKEKSSGSESSSLESGEDADAKDSALKDGAANKSDADQGSSSSSSSNGTATGQGSSTHGNGTAHPDAEHQGSGELNGVDNVKGGTPGSAQQNETGTGGSDGQNADQGSSDSLNSTAATNATTNNGSTPHADQKSVSVLLILNSDGSAGNPQHTLDHKSGAVIHKSGDQFDSQHQQPGIQVINASQSSSVADQSKANQGSEVIILNPDGTQGTPKNGPGVVILNPDGSLRTPERGTGVVILNPDGSQERKNIGQGSGVTIVYANGTEITKEFETAGSGSTSVNASGNADGQGSGAAKQNGNETENAQSVGQGSGAQTNQSSGQSLSGAEVMSVNGSQSTADKDGNASGATASNDDGTSGSGAGDLAAKGNDTKSSLDQESGSSSSSENRTDSQKSGERLGVLTLSGAGDSSQQTEQGSGAKNANDTTEGAAIHNANGTASEHDADQGSGVLIVTSNGAQNGSTQQTESGAQNANNSSSLNDQDDTSRLGSQRSLAGSGSSNDVSSSNSTKGQTEEGKKGESSSAAGSQDQESGGDGTNQTTSGNSTSDEANATKPRLDLDVITLIRQQGQNSSRSSSQGSSSSEDAHGSSSGKSSSQDGTDSVESKNGTDSSSGSATSADANFQGAANASDSDSESRGVSAKNSSDSSAVSGSGSAQDGSRGSVNISGEKNQTEDDLNNATGRKESLDKSSNATEGQEAVTGSGQRKESNIFVIKILDHEAKSEASSEKNTTKAESEKVEGDQLDDGVAGKSGIASNASHEVMDLLGAGGQPLSQNGSAFGSKIFVVKNANSSVDEESETDAQNEKDKDKDPNSPNGPKIIVIKDGEIDSQVNPDDENSFGPNSKTKVIIIKKANSTDDAQPTSSDDYGSGANLDDQLDQDRNRTLGANSDQDEQSSSSSSSSSSSQSGDRDSNGRRKTSADLAAIIDTKFEEGLDRIISIYNRSQSEVRGSNASDRGSLSESSTLQSSDSDSTISPIISFDGQSEVDEDSSIRKPIGIDSGETIIGISSSTSYPDDRSEDQYGVSGSTTMSTQETDTEANGFFDEAFGRSRTATNSSGSGRKIEGWTGGVFSLSSSDSQKDENAQGNRNRSSWSSSSSWDTISLDYERRNDDQNASDKTGGRQGDGEKELSGGSSGFNFEFGLDGSDLNDTKKTNHSDHGSPFGHISTSAGGSESWSSGNGSRISVVFSQDSDRAEGADGINGNGSFYSEGDIEGGTFNRGGSSNGSTGHFVSFSGGRDGFRTVSHGWNGSDLSFGNLTRQEVNEEEEYYGTEEPPSDGFGDGTGSGRKKGFFIIGGGSSGSSSETSDQFGLEGNRSSTEGDFQGDRRQNDFGGVFTSNEREDGGFNGDDGVLQAGPTTQIPPSGPSDRGSVSTTFSDGFDGNSAPTSSGRSSPGFVSNVVTEGGFYPAYTVYGEPCKDACEKRGYTYHWCTKVNPKSAGTWSTTDFCSPDSKITTYGDACLDACEKRGQNYYWCHKENSLWSYCTPDFLIRRSRNETVLDFNGIRAYTVYGEACQDECLQRGYTYTWCTKKVPSGLGNWRHYGYCTTTSAKTSDGSDCVDECRYAGYAYTWCRTRASWGYCTHNSFLQAKGVQKRDLPLTGGKLISALQTLS